MVETGCSTSRRYISNCKISFEVFPDEGDRRGQKSDVYGQRSHRSEVNNDVMCESACECHRVCVGFAACARTQVMMYSVNACEWARI